MIIYIKYLTLLVLLLGCENSPTDTAKSIEETGSEVPKNKDSEFTILSSQNPDQSWGYQILKDGKFIIDQKIIPAVQGNRGFSSREDAEKTANLIVEKIKNGDFPPTLSIEELDSLGVL